MIAIAIGAALTILLIIGMMQQEEIRLWHRHQELNAEKRRAELEEQRRAAAERIKTMLRERRGEIDEATRQMAENADGRPDGDAEEADAGTGPAGNVKTKSWVTPN